jgi:multidrug efflux pump subunit AcrA (membrane-fusion protein)
MTKTFSKTDADSGIYSIRSRVLGGFVVTGLLIGGIFGWASQAEVAGAVVVTGEVAVDRNLRVVQHRDGPSWRQCGTGRYFDPP